MTWSNLKATQFTSKQLLTLLIIKCEIKKTKHKVLKKKKKHENLFRCKSSENNSENILANQIYIQMFWVDKIIMK